MLFCCCCCCFAATLIKTKQSNTHTASAPLRQKRTQMVCSNKEAWKRLARRHSRPMNANPFDPRDILDNNFGCRPRGSQPQGVGPQFKTLRQINPFSWLWRRVSAVDIIIIRHHQIVGAIDVFYNPKLIHFVTRLHVCFCMQDLVWQAVR